MDKNAKKECEKMENFAKKQSKNNKNNQKTNEEQFINKSTFTSQTRLDDVKNVKNDAKTADIMEKNTQKVVEFIKKLLQTANINAEIEIKETEKAQIIEISSEDSKVLIGPHGEAMNALQTIVNNFITPSSKLSKKLLIDVDNYRDKQLELLRNKTKGAIEKCVQTAKPVSLDYMNAYERFIVHEIIMSDGRVTSESYGKEPRRFVKIFIK